MTETHDDHVQEAQRLLASRVADMRGMLDLASGNATSFEADNLLGEYGYQPDDSEEVSQEIVSNYGLAWERVSANFRDQTVTYSHQLSTGGPGDEFLVTFGPTGHGGWDVESVTYVYLPWFDRVEVGLIGGGYDVSTLPDGDAATVHDFYATFYADLIGDDNEGMFQ